MKNILSPTRCCFVVSLVLLLLVLLLLVLFFTFLFENEDTHFGFCFWGFGGWNVLRGGGDGDWNGLFSSGFFFFFLKEDETLLLLLFLHQTN